MQIDIERDADRTLTPNYSSQPASMLEIIAQLARDPHADVAKFSALLDLKERMDAKEAEKAFNAAFARLQPKLPKVSRDGKIEMGGKGSIKFATYENLKDCCDPLIHQEGFSTSFVSREGRMVLILRHSAGHQQESEWVLTPDKGPGRNDMQANGSGRSYIKRYLYTDALDIVIAGKDDDAKTAFPMTNEQEIELNDLMDGLEPNDIAAFKRYMAVTKIREIQRNDFTKATSALQAKRRQKGLS